MKHKRRREEKTHLDRVIGENIKNIRQLRSMSRDELAGVIDLTVSHLGLIERGERGATPVVLDRLVKACDISIDSLFTPQNIRKSDIKNSYQMKTSTIISTFNEQEYKALIHAAKGIISLRDNDDEVSNDVLGEN